MKSFLKLAALTLASTMLPVAAPAQSSPVIIYVNGAQQSFTQPPVTQNGRVFVPLRGVFQSLGASVVYSSGQINATRHGTTVSLTIGSTQATVNGQAQILDVAPFLIGDYTMIPLRFVAQALGATVNWNPTNNSVTINQGNNRPVPPPAPQPPPQPQTYFTYNVPAGPVPPGVTTVRFQINRPITPANITVRFDGTTVQTLDQNGARFSFTTPSLGTGTHRVRVFGRTNGGLPFDLNWSFQVRQ